MHADFNLDQTAEPGRARTRFSTCTLLCTAPARKMGITEAQRLCAIRALGDPALREMADRVAVCKLLRENPSHAALRDRLLEFRASGIDPEYYRLTCVICRTGGWLPAHA